MEDKTMTKVDKLNFEFNGKSVNAQEVTDAAMKDFKAKHADVKVKTFDVYINAAESKAYYVVNGTAENDYFVEL